MNRKRIFITLALLLCFFVTKADAETYVIGPDDLLEVKFWQDPTLNAMVRVSQDGMVTIDVIGEIKASGFTTDKLQSEIIKQMSRLNSRVSQCVVRVDQYNFQHVFVKGQVMNKGKLTFELIPDLWTIINEAGGVTDFGDLTKVTIIRGGEEAGKVEQVDVLAAISAQRLDQLPTINRQDVIEVPKAPGGVESGDIGDQLGGEKNIFYVLGAVNTPGPIKYQKDIDLLEAIALAGGATTDADYSKAKVVTKDGAYGKTVQIDLEKYTNTGHPARYLLKAEDTFILPNKKKGGLSLTSVIQIVGAVSTAVLLYDRLRNDE